MSIDFNILSNPPVTGSDMRQLVDQLARRADTNGDGSVSTTEFSRFLSELLDSVTSGVHAGNDSGDVASPDAPATPLPEPAPEPDPQPAADPTAVLPGWDPDKWGDLAHTTPKYVVGRILANYPPTPAGLQDALAEIQQAIPGTTLAKPDTLDIPGVGLVDVGLSFATGGNVGWWWGPVDGE